MRKLNTLKFKEKSEIIHDAFYDYSLVEYSNAVEKVKIICPIHGLFLQSPNSHLSGVGCPKCGKIKSDDSKRIVNFVDRAKKIHLDKYDYSKTNYKNIETKVIITCKEHGDFTQKPYHHLKGSGCPYCSKNRKLDTKLFIEKSNLIHHNTYDYSKVDYINIKLKVKIICSKHGEFLQSAGKHLMGRGCPYCKESKGEAKIRFILEQKSISFNRQYIFIDCRDILPLPFDFYLPDFNLCIEYDGKQHFEPLTFFGGDDGLKDSVKKDFIKTKYCKDNGIRLLRIKYSENILRKIQTIL